jgi:hypothetical protein
MKRNVLYRISIIAMVVVFLLPSVGFYFSVHTCLLMKSKTVSINKTSSCCQEPTSQNKKKTISAPNCCNTEIVYVKTDSSSLKIEKTYSPTCLLISSYSELVIYSRQSQNVIVSNIAIPPPDILSVKQEYRI